MDLQHAHGSRLVEHAAPGGGVQFLRPAVQGERIGTVWTGKRTTMGQLSQQSDRLVNGGGRHDQRTTNRFVANSASNASTSSSIVARSALYSAASSSTICAVLCVPSHRFRISCDGPSISIT